MEIKEIYLEENNQTDKNNINVYSGAIINYIKVVFNSDISYTRINFVSCDSKNLTYTINDDKTSLIIDTSQVVFNDTKTIMIYDVPSKGFLNFNITMNKDISITIDKFV